MLGWIASNTSETPKAAQSICQGIDVQLPGMSTEPVRVAIEVTWWPATNDWSISRSGWRRDADNRWQIEQIATSATPLSRHEVCARLWEAASQLVAEVEETDDPFSNAGAFQ